MFYCAKQTHVKFKSCFRSPGATGWKDKENTPVESEPRFGYFNIFLLYKDINFDTIIYFHYIIQLEFYERKI